MVSSRSSGCEWPWVIIITDELLTIVHTDIPKWKGILQPSHEEFRQSLTPPGIKSLLCPLNQLLSQCNYPDWRLPPAAPQLLEQKVNGMIHEVCVCTGRVWLQVWLAMLIHRLKKEMLFKEITSVLQALLECETWGGCAYFRLLIELHAHGESAYLARLLTPSLASLLNK